MQKKEEEKIVLALTSFQCFLHISKVQFRFIEVVLYLVVQRTDEGQWPYSLRSCPKSARAKSETGKSTF